MPHPVLAERYLVAPAGAGNGDGEIADAISPHAAVANAIESTSNVARIRIFSTS
jgi:hypothetical protein